MFTAIFHGGYTREILGSADYCGMSRLANPRIAATYSTGDDRTAPLPTSGGFHNSAIHPHHRHRLPDSQPLYRQERPLDVLHANGAARLLAVTQLLESLSRAELKSADDTDLQHIPNAAAILLRDSCDLLGVMG